MSTPKSGLFEFSIMPGQLYSLISADDVKLNIRLCNRGTCDTKSFDLGTLYEGTTKIQDFKFIKKNSGDYTLEFEATGFGILAIHEEASVPIKVPEVV